MNIAIVRPFLTLLLSVSVVNHVPTPAHDRMGYGPVEGDVQFVSSGVLLMGEDVILPVTWNAGEQILWVDEDALSMMPKAWSLVPEDVLLSLSGAVAGELGVMVS
jgi:hypothetical protein